MGSPSTGQTAEPAATTADCGSASSLHISIPGQEGMVCVDVVVQVSVPETTRNPVDVCVVIDVNDDADDEEPSSGRYLTF